VKLLLLLIEKDLRCLARSRHALISVFGFSLLLVVVASFAFRQVGLSQPELQQLTPGVLMLIFLFAGLLVLRETSLPEYRQRAILGVALSPVDPGLVFIGKFSTNLLLVTLVFLLNFVLLQIFLGVELGSFCWSLLAVLGLFSLGFSALGTLVSMLAYLTSVGEILFPLLFFPLLIPLMIGSLELMRQSFELGGSFDVKGFWFSLVLLFDLIVFMISLVMFEFVLRE